MAFPINRIIDFPEHTTKPDPTDAYAFFKTDVDEQKHFKHNVFKTFFVLRDEDTDIIANHEIQTNYKLKFGSAGEFQIYGNATDTFLDSVNPTGKTIFRYNAGTLGAPILTNFVSFDPVNNSMALHGNCINDTGAANAGIKFDGTNKPFILNQLNLGAHVRCEGFNISYTGVNAVGLEFDTGNNGIFNQSLYVLGALDVSQATTTNGLNSTGTINAQKSGSNSLVCTGIAKFNDNIQLGGKYLGYAGTDAGLKFAPGNDATFTGRINADGGLYSASNIDVDSHIIAIDYIRGYNLDLRDNISTPSTLAGYGRLFIDNTDGNFKIKFGNGSVVTIAVKP